MGKGIGGDKITYKRDNTTKAIVIALCVVFSLVPLAGAADNQNSKNQNTVSNNAITDQSLTGLNKEQISKLKEWLKDKKLSNDNGLKLGSSGEQVKKLQTWLKENEFYNGVIDGNFGADTEAAVKAFQKEVGLKEDGQVGDYTLLAMEQWDAYAAAITNDVSASSSSEKVYSKASKSQSYKSKKVKYIKKHSRYRSYRGYTNGMDCWAMSAYLSGKLRAQGYTVRTIQYATSMSSRHRSVQYYNGNSWVNYDYKANGYSSIYYATSNSKSGSVIS